MKPEADLLNPWLDASCKGFPHTCAPLRRSDIGAQGWNVLAGDLPLPLAVIRQPALRHNLGWMQRFADARGIDLAPHGKTTLSPQLLRQQLDTGAWGLTFASVTQAGVGAAAGARRCLIANQVFAPIDLAGIWQLQDRHPGLRVLFLVDSLAQLDAIEAWHQAQPASAARPFEVLLEVGVPGGRTGCRQLDQALALAQRLHASAACRLVGIECYEGLGATGEFAADQRYADALMQRVIELARACDQRHWFDADEVLLSAGGSAIFDLVAPPLRQQLSRPVRGLLRSGCYVTHDHGFYKRMVSAVNARLRCPDAAGLQPALEVWAAVQSCPEPGLAILNAGRRDLSYDMGLPTPIHVCPRGSRTPRPTPADWTISALNDQHAYLRGSGPEHAALQVGDRVALGISHPCTTFDKWRWMPLVDDDYRVCDALVTWF